MMRPLVVRVPTIRILLALVGAATPGCGRLGFEYLEIDATSADASAMDAETPADASDPDPADSDANQPDAGEPDAGELDAGELDAGGLDAGELDADAAPEASAPDCRLSSAGSLLEYRGGEAAQLRGTYLFSLEQTGLCVAPSGCSAALGAAALQSTCDLSVCQLWEALETASGDFALRNVASGACLYMTDSADGTAALTWECSDVARERWQAVCASNDSWRLVSKLSGKPLQGAGASTPGTPIEQAPEADSAQQRWTIRASAMPLITVLPTSQDDPGQLWRYTLSTPADTWIQPAFDDSAWSSGLGAFGDSDRGLTSARTPWSSGDIWLRQGFRLDSLPKNLSVRIFHDEDAQLYINGTLAFSEGSWSQGYRTVEVSSAVLATLRVGSNSVAVHCHNSSAPQFLDVGLVTVDWQ